MKEYFEQERLWEKRREAFGEACALCEYRFERDNGSVAQMVHARNYITHWEEVYRENMGLLFWGRPGNGKTFAAACIANALLERQEPGAPTVKMTTFATILNRLPGMSAQDKEWYLNGFTSCDLLILDDFGMERQTEYAREQVFHIIDSRYLARKPLIITTNLSLKELKNPPDLARQRVCDRLLELCVPVCFDGESLRREIGADKLRRYKQLINL